MKLIIEEIGSSYYIDIIASDKELTRIKFGEMVNTESRVKGKYFYVGVSTFGNLQEKELYWDDEEEDG
jgi:hypothetical protein